MEITRRELIVVAGATIAACGCSNSGPAPSETVATRTSGPVDAGAASNFAAPGIYSQFSDQYGFFIIREGEQLYALSSICTHRECKLRVVDNGFKCRCHGSTFTVDGHVTHGPARQDLPRWLLKRDDRNHLVVYPHVPA